MLVHVQHTKNDQLEKKETAYVYFRFPVTFKSSLHTLHTHSITYKMPNRSLQVLVPVTGRDLKLAATSKASC
jgi:hypothetical protein